MIGGQRDEARVRVRQQRPHRSQVTLAADQRRRLGWEIGVGGVDRTQQRKHAGQVGREQLEDLLGAC